MVIDGLIDGHDPTDEALCCSQGDEVAVRRPNVGSASEPTLRIRACAMLVSGAEAQHLFRVDWGRRPASGGTQDRRGDTLGKLLPDGAAPSSRTSAHGRRALTTAA